MGFIFLQALGALSVGIIFCCWGDWQLGVLILVMGKIYIFWKMVTYDPNKQPKEQEPRYISPSAFYANEAAKRIAARKKYLRERGMSRSPRRRYIATCAACQTSYSVTDSSTWDSEASSSIFSQNDDYDDTLADASNQDEWLTTQEFDEAFSNYHGSTVNPANGLPCYNGVDIEGNPYGTDSHHFEDSLSFTDDSFSSIDDSFSSFDDSFSSCDDSFGSSWDDYQSP